jgi:ABC-type transporter Mla subunit MlaD
MDRWTQRLAAWATALLALACAPALEVHVAFEQPVEIEEGAPVVYHGVEIGKVSGVTLRQASPEAPGLVALTLAIENDEITLREKDRFEVASSGLLGEAIVRITPSPEPSAPIPSGATVRGVPPLVTELGESLEQALDEFSAIASQKAQEALTAISESLESIEFDERPAEPEPEPDTQPE